MDKEAIKQLRNQLGLSQQSFAVKLGVGIATVSRWETGKTKPSALASQRLMRFNKGVI